MFPCYKWCSSAHGRERRGLNVFFLALGFACVLFFLLGAEGERVAADKEALAPLQGFVGAWKGVGQPKRGSSRGAWTQECECSWRFETNRASLVFRSPGAKYYASAELLRGDEKNQFHWIGTLPDGKTTEHFTGSPDENGKLTLVSDAPAKDRPARISLRLVARGNRLVVLYERKLTGTNRYTRLAEVGYTRKGSSFARGPSGPECIVTGGHGSMTVAHAGKTYYVCCTGCRDLFLEDPEAVLAEYRQRKAAEKAKKKGNQR